MTVIDLLYFASYLALGVSFCSRLSLICVWYIMSRHVVNVGMISLP